MPTNYYGSKTKHDILGTIPFGANKLNLDFVLLIEAYFRKEIPDHFFKIAPDQAEAMRIAKSLRGA
ncbi:hypothetical protein DDZ13_03575 [Coraliomargarita sinensis]|uniref:Uncharacterized protein n=2 Tax=Coraliomargarita sinensis TaxID=2174842 RepID=A0A317ZLK7_9BACT|nr:hypothetical protein DDZ13_03575 [Coraliomargarita sinensis]